MSACTSCGTSMLEIVSAAPSSTAPAAVTHEWSVCGERKNTSAENDVWVSSTSTNQRSHSIQTSCSSDIRSSRQNRSTISMPEGGSPARTARAVTPRSRRENAALMVGRYVISKASRNSPIADSVNETIISQNSLGRRNPSVNSDEPESSSATVVLVSPSRPQKIAA